MSDYELGRHEAQITALALQIKGVEQSVAKMDAKVDGIVVTLAERRGERKTVAVLATAAGGFGSLLMALIMKLWHS